MNRLYFKGYAFCPLLYKSHNNELLAVHYEFEHILYVYFCYDCGCYTHKYVKR